MYQSNKYNLFIKFVSAFILSLLIMIPLIEAFGRRFIGFGIPGASGWVQHLTLWIGLVGAVLATINGNHLSVSITQLITSERTAYLSKRIIEIGSIAVLLILTWAAVELVYYQFDSPEDIGGWFPVWLAQTAMPVTFYLWL